MPRNFEWVPFPASSKGTWSRLGRERERKCPSLRERERETGWLLLERGTDLIIGWHLFRSGLWSCDRILGPIGHSSFSHWPVGGTITITTFRSRLWWSVSNLGPIAQNAFPHWPLGGAITITAYTLIHLFTSNHKSHPLKDKGKNQCYSSACIRSWTHNLWVTIPCSTYYTTYNVINT